jgi:hypothetical protein
MARCFSGSASDRPFSGSLLHPPADDKIGEGTEFVFWSAGPRISTVWVGRRLAQAGCGVTL